MDKNRKLELIQRSLGLKHKLKVYDSMTAPQTHDELSVMMLAKWELEDELNAIEALLADVRASAVAEKKKALRSEDEGGGETRLSAKAKKKGSR